MTMLLYISVCLRTRQDTISYSFMYIIQKAEFRWIALMSKGLGGSFGGSFGGSLGGSLVG